MAAHRVPDSDLFAKGLKKCADCAVVKPLGEFHAAKSVKDGRWHICRDCRNARLKRRYDSLSRVQDKRAAAELKRIARDAARAEKRQNQPHVSPEERRSRRLAKLRKWKLSNPGRVKESRKASIAKNPGKYKEIHRKSRQKHRPRIAERASRRRARLASATIGDPLEIRRFYEFVRNVKRITCYWCKRVVPRRSRHVDHIIPIAKLGPHAIGNLCCSCSSCNLHKNAQMPEKFSGQFELFHQHR